MLMILVGRMCWCLSGFGLHVCECCCVGYDLCVGILYFGLRGIL